MVEFFLSAWSVAEDFVFVVPIVELWPFAEDEGNAEGCYKSTSKEEGAVTGSHGWQRSDL